MSKKTAKKTADKKVQNSLTKVLFLESNLIKIFILFTFDLSEIEF